jgi:hypothetical protein
VCAETVKPEWRDPEYGYRVHAARRLRRENPERPLVLVAGSSRAQCGVSPAAMGFAEGPGSPLLYNFGYRAATPAWVLLQVQRAWADGLRPRAVLVMVAIQEVHAAPVPQRLRASARNLSGRDVALVRPYAGDAGPLYRSLALARANPWPARLREVVRDLAPDRGNVEEWLATYHWAAMDRYGFVRAPVEWIKPEANRRGWEFVRSRHAESINTLAPDAIADGVYRDLVAWCAARGVAVAFCWAPESPAYRQLYGPGGRAKCETLGRILAGDLGAPLFPAPELPEGDFVDGFHLTPAGAEKYSRWLADNHLRSWMSEVLK